jgi:hypothetical protein
MSEDRKSPATDPAISRVAGVTDSERYLKMLCERTFLCSSLGQHHLSVRE